MIPADPLIFFLLFMPIIVFHQVFKKNWVDLEIKKAAIVGFSFGAISVFFTILVFYPIEWFIGSDLRSFMVSPREWWISLLAGIAIIGLVEEAIKAGGGLLAAYLVPFNKRPTVVFMGFASCALGFSFFENIQYYAVFGASVVLPRLIISSTAHIFFSSLCAVIAATALTRPRSDSVVSLRILTGILISAVFHGVFDFFVFKFNIQETGGILITCVAVFLLGIYEAWIATLRIDSQNSDGLMICSGCGAFSLGRARFCNFCGSRVVLSRRDFTIRLAK
ncbi:MAG: hypothetical protein Kow0029_16430 [Candidatus Rifleibacteriota bacterium]